MKLKEEIKEVLKKHKEVVVAYLYGSTVKGHLGKGSDIDVGLLLQEDFKVGGLYPASIAGEIARGTSLGRQVDVRILNHRSPRFLYQVVSQGQVILSIDEGKRVEFETYVIDRYLDFKPFYEQYDEKRRERLVA